MPVTPACARVTAPALTTLTTDLPIVSAAVGGGISLLMNYMSKKDEDKKKEEQRKAEEAAKQLSQYDLMEQHLRKMAEQETKIYMDANEVGIAQRVGNYSVGN